MSLQRAASSMGRHANVCVRRSAARVRAGPRIVRHSSSSARASSSASASSSSYGFAMGAIASLAGIALASWTSPRLELEGRAAWNDRLKPKKVPTPEISEQVSEGSKVEKAIDETNSVENEVADEQVDGQQSAYDPSTGEINWDCPCLGGMAHGPCGEEFKAAFSCFVYSEEEPKGIDCVEKFKSMQECFRKHPEVYAEEIEDDDRAEQEAAAAHHSGESSELSGSSSKE